MSAVFQLFVVPSEGEPHWWGVEAFGARSRAIKAGQALIASGAAKIVLVYRGATPTQLLVYRPQTYVHLERI